MKEPIRQGCLEPEFSMRHNIYILFQSHLKQQSSEALKTKLFPKEGLSDVFAGSTE